jgi:hypothetical protein
MFTLSDVEKERANSIIEKWRIEELEEQKAQMPNPPEIYLEFWDMGFAYHGAIGGEITYLFTPTSIGVIVHIMHNVLNKKEDITDYDTW